MITHFIYSAFLTCPRNYEKVGCYDEVADTRQLLVYDRYNIDWHNIEEYMHGYASVAFLEYFLLDRIDRKRR